jgi:very-short-patch-repair endonuclease
MHEVSASSGDVADRARRLFEFLAAAQRLRYAPVRTVDSYERDGDVFWLGELPAHPAVQTSLGQEPLSPDAPLLVVWRVLAQDAPTPPEDVDVWLDGEHADPERPPSLRDSRRVATEGGPIEGETAWLADHPEVTRAYEPWRAAWDEWAAQELRDRPARALYKELFGAYTAVTSQPEETELVLGVGCLAWSPAGHDRVRRHLLTVAATVTFDEATGAVSVVADPARDGLTLELDMLDPALSPAPDHRADIVERARDHEAHPLSREEAGDLLRRLANSLAPDARYDDSDRPPVIGQIPVVAFAPAIVLRRRSRLGLADVFDQISAAIAGSGVVPAGLLPLVDPDRPPPAEPDPTPGGMVDVDGETVLPLPLNAEQLEIIRRVDRQAQTLVQGPPGTGKTHLAAALISHLLAQGKRVLVTAQTDRALKEVRAKLPDEIKPLAVAVVGSDRSDMADLKVAVEGISSRSDEGDPETLATRTQRLVDDALAEIDELRRRRAELRQRLLDARAGDVAERSFAGYAGTLAALASRYEHDAGTHGWLRAHVTPSVDGSSPLTDDEGALWLARLRDDTLEHDGPEAARRLVNLSGLPVPEEFAELLDRYAAAAAGFAAVGDWAAHPAFDAVCGLEPGVRADVQQRMTLLARQIGEFEHRREPWMAAALSDVRTGRGAMWTARAEQIKHLLDGAYASLRRLPPAVRVAIADVADRASLAALAQHLLDHVREHGPVKVNPDGSAKIGTFASKAVKSSARLFSDVRVDGRQPVTDQQLTTVLLSLDVDKHLDALDRAWPADVVIPQEDTPQERYQWHLTEWTVLNGLLSVGQEILAEQKRFTSLSLPHPDWSDLDSIVGYARLVDAAAAHDGQKGAAAPLQRIAETTAAARRWTDAAPVCAALDDAVSSMDRAAYAAAYWRTRRLYEVRGAIAERDTLTARVAAAAPDLARAVTASARDDAWMARLPSLATAWDWARLGAWILTQTTEDPNELLRQLDVADDTLRRVVERLTATRAWSQALAPGRLTGRVRADLGQYVLLVRRFGKTGGKFAAQRQREIRTAMDRCREAVPVWIMPIYRIAEQLRVAENMFDVVIVDEASQAGLEATFLQYLAPKIVVIGDDKQVSPSAVGVEQQPLRDLARQYLGDNRYAETWQDPKLSLFDAATIWYGSKKTLVEHRRCVPEIIEFSNRIAYEPEGIRLVPVRQIRADRLEPVKAVHVTDGYEAGGSGSKVNRPEAQAIVEQIEKCLADPRYEGKTFGVISLLGPRQAKVINDMLLERVPPEDWTARDLRCGDAAAFQGSERDVVFLSMVSAPEPGQRMGALTVDANVQRYNVAASRAKDQMWVFHTVRLDQLTNVEDMRRALLDYCYHGVRGLRLDSSGQVSGLVPEDRRVDPFDSLFEQRVHNRIVERGYTVIPQYDAMGYRIDLVVVGSKGSLAVECDGDYWHGPDQYAADLARERDLRRNGWEFFRIRESAFYVDQPAVLSQLWATLDELEIRPASWSQDAEHDGDEVDFVGGEAEPARCDLPPSTRLPSPEDNAVLHERGATDLDDDEVDAHVATIAAKPVPAQATRPERIAPSVPAARSGLAPYQEFRGFAPAALDASPARLDLILRDIIEVEGPIVGHRIHSAYVGAAGGQRVSRNIAHALDSGLARMLRKGALVAHDPLGRAGNRSRTFRLPDQPIVVQRVLGPRDLDDVPPLELAALLRDAAVAAGWSDRDALFREALRRLDRVRLTTNVRATLSAVLPLAYDDTNPA